MSALRVNLLFGFLGSGKTTLVRRILSERAGERPMAVIVNEFGDVGVDGDVIAGSNVNLVELTSGCLCCTLRGSLTSAVEELREKAAVEQIVVEATGVASPGDMLEDLNDSKFARDLAVGPLVTVVDAPKFTRLQEMLGEFYEDQVENADVLVLNKIDLATRDELERAQAAVREINPDATLLFAEQGDTDLALLLDGPESELLAQMKAETAGRREDDDGHDGHDHDHDPGIGSGSDIGSGLDIGSGPDIGSSSGPDDGSDPDPRHDHDHAHGHDPAPGHPHPPHAHAHAPAESFVVEAPGDFSGAALARVFAAMPANVWRSKGFLTVDAEPAMLQFTMGQLEIESAPARERPYLVVIGQDLDRAVVEAALLGARREGRG